MVYAQRGRQKHLEMTLKKDVGRRLQLTSGRRRKR